MKAISVRTLVVGCVVVCLVACLQLRGARGTTPDTAVGILQFHGTPLSEAIDSLAQSTHRKIVMDWTALAKVRVVPALPITIDLSNRTLGHALDKLVADVGGDYTVLGYEERDGSIYISTKTDVSQGERFVRTYDIRKGIKGAATRQQDIAAIIKRVRGIDPLSWKDTGGSTGQVKELSGQLIVSQTPLVHERIIEELHDVITDHGPQGE